MPCIFSLFFVQVKLSIEDVEALSKEELVEK